MMQPVAQQPAELLLKAQGVRVAIFDVDGVLTDGGLYFTASGETIKRFHVLDGYGIGLLRASGITPLVITGRDSEPLRVRLKALGIDEVHCGVKDKARVAEARLQALQVPWEQVAVIGDDWPDLPLMQRCRFAAAPPEAHAEVLAVVDFVTTRRGGHGAAREFCDLLLMAAGRYVQHLRDACP
jgi:3-deoxy-D-manno-octulosonate 8-phosphate phosphatase (KDO 8-P phosphatase)